jgi:aspartyl/glutamyl-tRNA(Asn/Gln) amidotransferase C subunit
MVEKKEIDHLGDLVKVELKDSEKYIRQIEQVIRYFDGLDNVEFDSDATLRREVDSESLRDDKYIQYDTALIDWLKKDQNNFIRAPKMV